MSVKTKAKELATKGKEFVKEHHVLKVIGITLFGAGCYKLGDEIRCRGLAVGLEEMVNANVFGFGVTKEDGSFVQVGAEELVERIKAYKSRS